MRSCVNIIESQKHLTFQLLNGVKQNQTVRRCHKMEQNVSPPTQLLVRHEQDEA